MLFLRKVVDGFGGTLDGGVEAVQAVDKITAAQGVRCEGVDHLLDFVGDDVAAGEVGVVEDGAEQALGQEMLNQHLLDRGLGQVGIDRLAAFFKELGEGGDKAAIGLPLILDQLRQAAPDVGHFVFELGDCLLPGGVLLRAVAEEGLERLDQLGRFGQVGVQRQALVLPEDGALRRLEEDVVARVAGLELALDFRGQVVVNILGLPIAVRQLEIVDQRAVHDDALAAGVERELRHEGPAGLAGAGFEEGLEGGAHGGFVGDGEAGEPVEGGVVGFDGAVGGFEVQGWHFDWVPSRGWGAGRAVFIS